MIVYVLGNNQSETFYRSFPRSVLDGLSSVWGWRFIKAETYEEVTLFLKLESAPGNHDRPASRRPKGVLHHFLLADQPEKLLLVGRHRNGGVCTVGGDSQCRIAPGAE